MQTQKIIFLMINVLGGSAVIGSYIHGLLTHPENRQALWGNVPQGLIPVYSISMLLAASGYLALFFYLLLGVDAAQVRIAGRFTFPLFYLIYLLILVPSVFWMPLTYAMIAAPSSLLWFAIRFVLWTVGVGALALLAAMLCLEPQTPGWAYFIAVIGSMVVAFQTFVLDAILWVKFFKV
jgi:hypothetical protein